MIKNDFSKGPQGWSSYEYHASMVAGQNIFILATWEEDGGVDGGGYVWADQARWSCDAPEKPLSILPLIVYRSWTDEDPVDLRGGELSVYLRGDDLKLNGAQCYFWAHVGGDALALQGPSYRDRRGVLDRCADALFCGR